MVELKPFIKSDPHLKVESTVQFSKSNTAHCHLFYKWQTQTPLSGVPIHTEMRRVEPTRAADLWKTTCFEAFIQTTGQRSYWEINLSPMGGWNVYEFTDYRNPQPPVECSSWQLISLESCSTGLNAVFEFHITTPALISVGLTAVIETANNEKSHWAVVHKKSQPDFHESRSFTITERI